jgi:putative intracellular protease/amidase
MVDGDMDAAKAAAQGWQYAGYDMTIFSNEEEHYVEDKLMDGRKVPFYVAEALQTAGGKVTTGGFFQSHIVQDRELITGQNPPSDHAMAKAFLTALDHYTASAHAA